ncbi:hypothetical protein EPN15_01470 [Patescibacteria group bacterium]|nr:MAG: hypothetical protein EPN15_01470 [Patescibacteria group bacterium]
MNKKFLAIGIIFLIVGFVVGYWYGGSASYDKGYNSAIAEIKAQQEEAAKKASEEAAKTANPFQVNNPLEGVETNPFDKAKKILNPFAN